jgi:WD40 repeat protein
MKFSPDGKYLCVGSHDNYFYLFDLAGGIAAMQGKKHGKSSSFISHLDWSADSSCIRTIDGSYELLFYTIPDGAQNTSGASSYKDTAWATQSCILGWGVQGIFQPGQSGDDVNTCAFTNDVVQGLGY